MQHVAVQTDPPGSMLNRCIRMRYSRTEASARWKTDVCAVLRNASAEAAAPPGRATHADSLPACHANAQHEHRQHAAQQSRQLSSGACGIGRLNLATKQPNNITQLTRATASSRSSRQDAALWGAPHWMCPSHGAKLCACTCRAFSISHSSSRASAHTGTSGQFLDLSAGHIPPEMTVFRRDIMHLYSIAWIRYPAPGRVQIDLGMALRHPECSAAVAVRPLHMTKGKNDSTRSPVAGACRYREVAFAGCMECMVQVQQRHRLSACLVCAKLEA